MSAAATLSVCVSMQVKRHTDEAIILLGKSEEYDDWLKKVEADVSNIAAVSKAIGIGTLLMLACLRNGALKLAGGRGATSRCRHLLITCPQSSCRRAMPRAKPTN